jgi:formate hydrogenlyase subunit 3/multisubunit Na+/H+ antiporter MnhD subunit
MKIRALLFSLVLVALAGVPLFMIGAAVLSTLDGSTAYVGVIAGVLAVAAAIAVAFWRMGRRGDHPRAHGGGRMALT